MVNNKNETKRKQRTLIVVYTNTILNKKRKVSLDISYGFKHLSQFLHKNSANHLICGQLHQLEGAKGLF